jgi:hypothetical protein
MSGYRCGRGRRDKRAPAGRPARAVRASQPGQHRGRSAQQGTIALTRIRNHSSSRRGQPQGLGVYREWQEYAAGYEVAVALAGNKIQTREDVAFLRQHIGDDLLTRFGHESAVRAMEQGRPFGVADLGTQTSAALAAVHGALDTRPRDWARCARQAAEFHLKNASGWASAATGQDRRTDRPGLHPRPSRGHGSVSNVSNERCTCHQIW